MPLDEVNQTVLQDLAQRFLASRKRSEALAAPLSPEDWMVQSMEDASPVKWNLAHTSWFYETFLLAVHDERYEVFDPHFAYLFNSYYNQVGEMHPRPSRGLISRPSAADIILYRDHVTKAVLSLLDRLSPDSAAPLARIIELGCAHEEQHQELLLTDIKHALFQNPLYPAAYEAPQGRSGIAAPLSWTEFEGGLVDIGHGANDGHFAFDNEGPRHQKMLMPFALMNRCVTNGEFASFIEDGGYSDSRWWLSDGWALVQAEGWTRPLYWLGEDDDSKGEWCEYTLFGKCPLDMAAPVCHLSFYEAAAFAEWSSYRLPTEEEWERAASNQPVTGNFLCQDGPRPPAAAKESAGSAATGVRQLFGDVWEWTASPYIAYPGYRTPDGAIGEYNGKFMSSQMVLRGGSCATPEGHVRATYRNFFPPHARWQFAGLRLARDIA